MELAIAALSGQIKLSAEGEWFHEGVKVTHERTIEFLFQSIYADGEGYFLKGDKMPVPVTVEDTAFFVRELHDDQTPWQIKLSDGSMEPLEMTTLDSGKDNVFYCRVKGARARARFVRPVYYQLTKHLVEKDGYLGLVSAGNFYPLLSKIEEEEKAADKITPLVQPEKKSAVKDKKTSALPKEKKSKVKKKISPAKVKKAKPKKAKKVKKAKSSGKKPAKKKITKKTIAKKKSVKKKAVKKIKSKAKKPAKKKTVKKKSKKKK